MHLANWGWLKSELCWLIKYYDLSLNRIEYISPELFLIRRNQLKLFIGENREKDF